MTRRAATLWLVAVALLSLVSFAGWCVVNAANRSLEAEKNLHAVICVASALEVFVRDHKSWPSSWDDLAKKSGPLSGSMFELPRDLDAVRSRVVVRFGATPEELAHPEDAHLVEPLGPCYTYDFRLEPLYQRLRETFVGNGHQ
jgi:hypothetical protein